LIKIATDVADAMLYLHSVHNPKIVHRDLKAQHVPPDAAGRAKVCEFGIAKFKDKHFVSTVNGQAGTVFSMAPEISDDAPVSEKVSKGALWKRSWE
jgi:serine/threonine protein kinase